MKGNRITVRLSDGEMERLRGFCRETDSDISHAVIQALNALLSSKEGATPSTEAPARLFPPEEILTAICKYLAWGGDMDPRVELKRQFIEILACTFALTKLFPRDKGIQKLYLALRPLCPYFGMDTV
jgi:hypothetical protein